MASENGWEPAKASPDQCEWITVPGTNPPVSLQLLKGWPLAIMRAVAADFNAFIQPLRDGDSAARTETNSVPTSNHLNATAMDLDWDDHPFHVRGTFNADQMSVIRELLAFYEDTIFWAGDWNDPIDEMHWQMGYDSYNNPHTGDFINRKIRADGFSTFRRGAAPATPPAAQVLSDATGLDLGRAAEILPTVISGLQAADCTNVNRIAMWLAQCGEESAGFSTTEEFASGAEYEGRCSDLGNCSPGDGVKYKGRSWIQITGKAHYQEFSEWAFGKGLIGSPTQFVDNPGRLADLQWAGIGAAWYWTVSRPDINALSDAGDVVTVTHRINGGENGLADRQNRYARAHGLGDQLLALTTAAPPTQPGDDMALVPQDQWDRVYRELTQRLPSRSPLRHLDQTAFYPDGLVDTMAGMLLNTDGSEHVQYVSLLAGYGHPPTLALLQEVASAAGDSRYPDRQDDAKLAQAILADVTSAPAPVVVNNSAPAPASQVVYLPAPVAPAPAPAAQTNGASPAKTTGQIVGDLYEALDALRLADALPIEARAPLSALISVLQTKNGSQL